MKYIGNKGLADFLKNNKSLDFVAFAMTPWHAHALNAAIKYLSAINKTSMKGVVIIKPHSESGWMIDEESFANLSADIFFYRNDEKLSDRLAAEIKGMFYYVTLSKPCCGGKCLYVLNPNGFRYPTLAFIQKAYYQDKELFFVSIDEGLGIHLMSEKTWFQTCLMEQENIKGVLTAILKQIEIKLFSKSKIKKVSRYIDANLLIKDNSGKCFPNGDMPLYFKEVIQQSAENIDVPFLEPDGEYVIINTQPFADYVDTGEDEKIRIIKTVIDLFNKHDYKVIIKPHPRETNLEIYEELGAEVLSCVNITQEILLCKLKRKPTYIIGFYSTTLVTGKLFFDVNPISLNKLLLNSCNVNDKYVSIFKNFEISFSDIVAIVNSYNELNTLLSKR